MKKIKGFTLAEILITLAIIGVVAAMTIPTLIAKINNIITDNQIKVFNAKLIKGLNLTKTAGDLNDTYDTTYDFLVNGLGKNLKMAKVCDKDHIRDCIPYDKIKYEDKNGNEKTVNIKDLNSSKLQMDIAFKDIAAFVLADGTPAIVSYNLKCIDDPDKADTEINSCLAGIYDINGTRKPNKFGTKVENGKTVFIGDIKSFNGARVGGASCLSIGGNKVCIAKTAKIPRDIWQDYFEVRPKGINNWNDNQLVARKYCQVEGGHAPSNLELSIIAQVLYGDTSIGSDSSNYTGLTMKNKEAVYTALGIEETATFFQLWSSECANGYSAACYGVYNPNNTYIKYGYGDDDKRAVCLE